MNPTLVILPTYNEAENIPLMLKRLVSRFQDLDILVVDDSSPDGTGELVETFVQRSDRIFLLSRPKKEGLALAYLAGFAWGLHRDYQKIVQMDADFSHDPENLSTIIEKLDTADAVFGCRYIEGGGTLGWSWVREGISRGGNFYAQRILKLPFRDLTGGFNGWRASALRAINLSKVQSRGYAFQVELKYRAHRKRLQLEEIPIKFENRRYGTSKMSHHIIWEGALRVLQMRRAFDS